MLKDIKAVIFDLDGTLVDSMWVWVNIDTEYMAERNLVMPPNFKEEIEGMSFEQTAVYFKETFKLSDSLEVIKDTWNSMAVDKYRNEVPFKTGAIEFIKHLKANNIKIGIATANHRSLVLEVLKAYNVLEDFDSIITSCEVNVSKPAPDVYLAAAKQMSIEPKDCIVFEDVPNGIKGGKAAGMKTCAVEDDFTKDLVDVKKGLANYYIKDYKELLEGNFEVCNV